MRAGKTAEFVLRESNMQTNYDLVVIGGGPAGSSAATFAARCRWKVLVVDRSQEAGYLGGMGNVSYFPGFPEAIDGKELLKRMRRQAELVGVSFVHDTVKSVTVAARPFKTATESGKEFDSGALIIAPGAAARSNYLHGEREFFGRGVSHDAIADGPAVAKRTAAVVGRNRLAAEEALVLSRFADKIHFIIPSNRMEVENALMKQLQDNRVIELHFSTSLKNINGTDHVSSITIFSGGQEKEIAVAGVFTYVHDYQTTTGFLEKTIELSQAGAVCVDEKLSTSVEGVFACGDVICGRPQLPAISSAQGLLAGISADRFLSAGN